MVLTSYKQDLWYSTLDTCSVWRYAITSRAMQGHASRCERALKSNIWVVNEEYGWTVGNRSTSMINWSKRPFKVTLQNVHELLSSNWVRNEVGIKWHLLMWTMLDEHHVFGWATNGEVKQINDHGLDHLIFVCRFAQCAKLMRANSWPWVKRHGFSDGVLSHG